jgi:hypothetical protein
MYICTFPRMRTLKFFCAAFALVTGAVPTFAQNRQASASFAQAELEIRVTVAPVILPPRHDRDRDRDRDNHRMVSYHLSSPEPQLYVTKEVRRMLVSVNGSSPSQQPVQLTTVVVQ